MFKTYKQFVFEDATSPSNKGEVRIEIVKNKIYLVNFEQNILPHEKKKFIDHIQNKHGSIITQITTHLDDLVIDLSIFIDKAIGESFKQILNDIFTRRMETNDEKRERKEEEKSKE